jgi:cobalt-zinc-cadmium efflux system membrane fusion protein
MRIRISYSLQLLSIALAFHPNLQAAERQSKFAVTDQQMQALGIQTAPLQAGAAPVILTLPAQVSVPPNREQIVSAPLSGLATQVLVQPNQTVQQGAALIRISSPELGPLQLQLLQAASRAGLARKAAQREKALFDEGIIARRRHEEAQANLSESEATLRQAKAALRFSGMGNAQIERVVATGKLEDAITLSAQSAGTVVSIDVKPGQRVEPSVALLHLAQVDRLALEIQAPAAQAAAWRIGSKLTLQDRPGTAIVTSISPIVAAGSQTVAIRAALDPGASGLRPGERVTVQLPLPAASGSWDVPLAAVAHDNDKAVVFVRNGAAFEARAVSVVSSAGQRVRVSGALRAGEKIAVSGVIALKGSWLGEKGGD